MEKRQNKKYEIELFDAAANTRDYEISVGWLYLYLNKLIRKYIGTLDGIMLEAGCGTGAYGKNLVKRHKKLRITGVDISPQMIQRANNKTKNYSAIEGDLEDKKLFKSRYFDYIYCPFVVHHFPNPEKIFENFEQWIKPDGFIAIVEPNSLNIVSRLSNVIRKVVETVLGKRFLVKHLLASPNEVDHTISLYLTMLKKHGFKLSFCETKYVELRGENMFSIGGIKVIMCKITNYLIPKSPLSHSLVIMFAQKV